MAGVCSAPNNDGPKVVRLDPDKVESFRWASGEEGVKIHATLTADDFDGKMCDVIRFHANYFPGWKIEFARVSWDGPAIEKDGGLMNSRSMPGSFIDSEIMWSVDFGHNKPPEKIYTTINFVKQLGGIDRQEILDGRWKNCQPIVKGYYRTEESKKMCRFTHLYQTLKIKKEGNDWPVVVGSSLNWDKRTAKLTIIRGTPPHVVAQIHKWANECEVELKIEITDSDGYWEYPS